MNESLRSLAERVARSAGEHLAESLAGAGPQVDTKTSATDLVTDMDRWAERHITESILAERPDDSIVGEEGADVSGSSGVTWTVDPIDGTVNFVHGMPGFNVSIAAISGGETVAGAVFSPLHQEMFSAAAGSGATLNGRPIHCSEPADLATSVLGTGFSYDAAQRGRQVRVLLEMIENIADIRRVGAAALDLCWVACGRFDGFWEIGLNSWDHAAGALVAAEAGARVEVEEAPGRPSFTVAAAPEIWMPLRDLLAAVGAADV